MFIKKDNFYHLPHNSVKVEEFDFMINTLDINKKVYTAEELQRLFLIEEVKKGVFENFHSKQFKNFTDNEAPDKEKLYNRFLELDNEMLCPSTVIKSIYELIQEKGPELAFQEFFSNRQEIYKKFLSNPEKYYIEFINTPYTDKKIFKYVWAETVRDYIQFLSYIGIIPAYYKGWGRDNEMTGDAGFVISALGKKYINKEISIESLLLKYKYRNSLINLDNYPQYSRELRPFFLTLKVLKYFKENGVIHIERNLLSSIVSCLSNEDINNNNDIKYILTQLKSGSNKKITDVLSMDSGFKKEIGRFALPLIKFLEGTGLIESKGIGKNNFISITTKGENLYSKEPKKIALYNGNIFNVKLTPIVGYILKYFSDSVTKGIFKINVDEFYKINPFLASIIDFESFLDLLNELNSENGEYPILSIEKSIITLNNIDFQFSINSSSDFSDIIDSNFVEGIELKPNKQEIIKIEYNAELNETTKLIEEVALSSDGEKYEEVLYNALCLLIGESYVKRLGNNGTRAQRLSDLVWKVPILFDDEAKELLVIFEAKSGNAIKAFDERKEKDDIKNTIQLFSNEMTNIAGIWYIVVDSRKIPESEHGGFRGGNNSLSFEQKLLNIQLSITLTANKPVLVSAMNVYSFIEFYKYLYQISRGFGNVFKYFNETITSNFWMWGPLFQPVKSFCKIFNNNEKVKSILRTN